MSDSEFFEKQDAAKHRANPPELFIIDDDSGQEVMTLPFKDVLLC